jgi:hypothetical protein
MSKQTDISKGYVVEVCTKIGLNSIGEFCYDRCEYDMHEVRTLEQARKLARELLPQDQFGEIAVRPFVRDKFGCVSYDWDAGEIVG